MNKLVGALLAALMIGAHGAALAQAKPAPKGPSADEKAIDKAVANYNRNKGKGMGKDAAAMDKAAAKKK